MLVQINRVLRLFGLPLAVATFGGVFLLGGGTALAAGEQYRWQDKNTLVVTGGNYGSKDTKIGSSDESVSFSLTIKDKKNCTVSVKIEIHPADVGKVENVDTNGCNDADLPAGAFTSPANISDEDKGPEAQIKDQSCEQANGLNPLAWFGCAMLGMLDGAISLLDKAISELLYINADKYDSVSIRSSHTVFLRLALLLLLPMMFFMVIGTALGIGPFDAYTVRKALPRMLVATVFIVVSLPLTQFGIALSNVTGSGIANMLYSMQPDTNKIGSLSNIFGGGDGAAFTALAGSAALLYAGPSLAVSWGIAGSFGLVTLVALLIGFVVLVMREVLLISLMVVAPLAILVWIFPGNDKLWNIWKTTFIAMLMMYPLVSLLIASGRLVAGVVVN